MGFPHSWKCIKKFEIAIFRHLGKFYLLVKLLIILFIVLCFKLWGTFANCKNLGLLVTGKYWFILIFDHRSVVIEFIDRDCFFDYGWPLIIMIIDDQLWSYDILIINAVPWSIIHFSWCARSIEFLIYMQWTVSFF